MPSFLAGRPSDRRHRVEWAAAVVFLFAAAIFLGRTLTGAWDVWWHMLVGRLAFADPQALRIEELSHTMAGAPWRYKDLLADVALYLGYDALGYAWFAILKGLAVIGVAAGIHLCVASRDRRPVVSVVACGLAIAAVQYRLVERPVLFSLALFALSFAAVERARRAIVRDGVASRLLAWAPAVAVSWLWVLLHREGLVGVGLLLAFALEAWVARALGGRASRLFAPRGTAYAASATIAFLAAAALSFANPSGWHLHASALAVAGSDALRRAITDWSPIGPAELWTHFPVTLAAIGAALVAWVADVTRPPSSGGARVGVSHLGLLLFFGALTLLDSARWVPYLSLTACVIVARALPSVGEPLARRLPARIVGARGWSSLVGVALFGLLIAREGFGAGVGPMPDRFPDGAIAFAKEHELSGNAVNAFHLGGYLLWEMWPDVRVSLDGRNDLIYPPATLLEGLRAQKDPAAFARVRAAFGAEWVLASNLPGHLSHAFLFRDPDWMMVYWSDPAVIYVRRRAYPELAGLEYRYIDPAAVDASVVEALERRDAEGSVIERLRGELMRMTLASPKSTRALAATAIYYYQLGAAFFAKRDAIMERLEKTSGGRALAEELSRRWEHAAGDSDGR